MMEYGTATGYMNAPTTPSFLWTQSPRQTEHSTMRFSRYQLYRDAYIGRTWLTEAAPGERRLTLNYLRVLIDKKVSYLCSQPVGYEAIPIGGKVGRTKRASSKAAETAESWIEDVAEFNHWALLDFDTATSASVLGDGAWTVRWDAESRLPRVTAVDPQGLDCVWRADDLTTLLWVKQQYWMSVAELSPDAYRHLTPEQARSREPLCVDEEWTATTWVQRIGSSAIAGGVNPYGTIPYIVFPNRRMPGEFWGDGDLVDLLPLQRELNGRMSIFSRILEVSGNPITVVTGATDTSTLRVGPGQMWELPEGADAKVLALLQSGIGQAHFEYLDKVYRGLHDLAEMPRTAFGDSTGSAKSGVALEVEMQPLLHKVERARGILGVALQRRAALCLAVANAHGAAVPAGVRWRLHWPPILPKDRTALVAQEAALVGSGIHAPTTAGELLGDDDPQEQFARVLVEGAALTAAGFKLSTGSGGAGLGGGS